MGWDNNVIIFQLCARVPWPTSCAVSFYSWPWTTQGLGYPPSLNLKTQVYFIVGHHTHSSSGSTSLDSTNEGSCSTVVFTVEKNLRITGPLQFKPILLKSQLVYHGERKHCSSKRLKPWNVLAIELLLFFRASDFQFKVLSVWSHQVYWLIRDSCSKNYFFNSGGLRIKGHSCPLQEWAWSGFWCQCLSLTLNQKLFTRLS